MADIITLPVVRVERQEGNGALETVRRYFEHYSSNTPVVDDILPADHFLMWLWAEGFKVVPLDNGATG